MCRQRTRLDGFVWWSFLCPRRAKEREGKPKEVLLLRTYLYYSTCNWTTTTSTYDTDTFVQYQVSHSLHPGGVRNFLVVHVSLSCTNSVVSTVGWGWVRVAPTPHHQAGMYVLFCFFGLRSLSIHNILSIQWNKNVVLGLDF